MGSPLRILHTADSHVGAGLPVRPRLDLPRRGDDLLRSYAHVMGQATERQVDLVIHAGDLFNRSKPTSRALAAAADPLLAVAAAGIPVVIVPGNHERSEIPATLLLSHPNIHILAESTTRVFALGGYRVAVSGFPCLRRLSAKRFAAALDQTGWADVEADVRILAAHQTFESATCGPADFRFRSGDDVVERSCIPAAFDYVAAGHIHRHQVIDHPVEGGPPIVYSGSPDRISMAEKDEPKGYVLVEVDGRQLTHTFVAHEVRPMVACPIDVSDWSAEVIAEHLESVITGLPENAVAAVRLTGRVGRGGLGDLRLTTLARRLRPDVLFSASTQAVEYTTSAPASGTSSGGASAFDSLCAPREPIVRALRADVGSLPTGCGVYAMYDAEHRLLYVGKSKTLRARVRAHLRGGTGARRFDGWSSQIASMETREACSDWEALLIEAELVRRLRPPFNRQMRRWRAYCHLVDYGGPHGGLRPSSEPSSKGACFGPYRSRGMAESVAEASADHFKLARCPADEATALPLLAHDGAGLWCHRHPAGLCTAPCAGRCSPTAYRQQVLARDALLDGRQDGSLVALETELEEALAGGGDADPPSARLRQATTLRAAFELGATIRKAKAMLPGMLILPGDTRGFRTVTLTPAGLYFDNLAPTRNGAQRVLGDHRARTRGWHPDADRPLPKAVLDALCIAVRAMRGQTASPMFLSHSWLADITDASLLARAAQDGNSTRRAI